MPNSILGFAWEVVKVRRISTKSKGITFRVSELSDAVS